MLLDETGHDFSQYKANTVKRSIERRMEVLLLETIEEYVKYLQQNSTEKRTLFREMLTDTVSFFRDPEMLETLEKQILPKIFAKRPADTAVRFWLQGCSTGEDAYSLAILLVEHMNTLGQNYKVQIFATDIDNSAINTALAGHYPASIANDISPKRLTRFFSVEADGKGNIYRIHKNIRDMVIFFKQDVMKVPPFSKIDLISSRSILGYMSTDLQKKIISTFHYTLKPNGYLFLDAPESLGDFANLFTKLDGASKFFHRRQGQQSVRQGNLNRNLAKVNMENGSQSQPFRKRTGYGTLSFRELTERTLLRQVSQTGILVNGDGDIFYLHGRTGMYLEAISGEGTVNNILKMAREGLQQELMSALHKVKTSQKAQRRSGLKVYTNGSFIIVNLSISPVVTGPATTEEEPLYLVVLEEICM